MPIVFIKYIGVKTGIQVHQSLNALDRNSLLYENILVHLRLIHLKYLYKT